VQNVGSGGDGNTVQHQAIGPDGAGHAYQIKNERRP